jgi:hypothetical protein
MKQETGDEILKALKESVEIQKDIRSILLHSHGKQLSEETGVPLVDDDGEERDLLCYSKILFNLRMIEKMTSWDLRGKENEQQLGIKKMSREGQRNLKKMENFWSQHLSRKGDGKSAWMLLTKRQLTYADLLEVLIQEHDWNKNTTRAANELETQIRRFLRGSMSETKGEFEQFFDEANKSNRRNFRRVPLSIIEFNFIFSFLDE